MSQVIGSIANQARHIGRIEGSVSQVAPLICNDMQFTDPFLMSAMAGMPWIVASFPLNGEPWVHGFGLTADAAMQSARKFHEMDYGRQLPEGAVPCRRQENRAQWLSGSGKEVTLDHMSIRKVFTQ